MKSLTKVLVLAGGMSLGAAVLSPAAAQRASGALLADGMGGPNPPRVLIADGMGGPNPPRVLIADGMGGPNPPRVLMA